MHGHEVTALVRRDARIGRASRTWDPYSGAARPSSVESADVVVNLAGSPLFGNPHSERYRRELLESRVVTTRVLAEAVAGSDRRPALLANNGTSFYGDHGDDVLTEESESRGDALLTRVTREWQAADACPQPRLARESACSAPPR